MTFSNRLFYDKARLKRLNLSLACCFKIYNVYLMSCPLEHLSGKGTTVLMSEWAPIDHVCLRIAERNNLHCIIK